MARQRHWNPSRWKQIVVEQPRTAQGIRELRAFLPPLNFITIHYAYFIAVPLFSSLVFWGSSHPEKSISYVDSLFVTVSAMTEAGLNTVNLSEMTTWQQILLWLLILFGGPIWVSMWTVSFRLHAFEKHFEDVVRPERQRREKARANKRTGSSVSVNAAFFRTVSLDRALTMPAALPVLGCMGSTVPPKGSTGESDRAKASKEAIRRPISLPEVDRINPCRRSEIAKPTQRTDDEEVTEDVAQPAINMGSRITFADDVDEQGNRDARTTGSVYATDNWLRRRNVDASGPSESNEEGHVSPMHNLLNKKTAGRNGQIHGLTAEEREHLGGCEYRALKVLSVIVPLYFVLWQFLGCIALGAWISNNRPGSATGNGIGPWWAGIFFGVSAFNNSGMALLDLNVIPFQNSYFVLITMGAMILAGNTAYPVLLRFIVWSMLKMLSWTTTEECFHDFKETLTFILKYPRRVYTHMFPSRQTWWLLFMVVFLNVTDWVAFELLNLGNPPIESIPIGSRIIDGLFQAIAVRSGGFYIVPISDVYIGLQILYVIMMYISVYPVVITMRHSNVYEERSLGIYANDSEAEADIEEGNELGLRPGLQLMSTKSTTANPQRPRQSAAARLSHAFKHHFAWHGVGVMPPRTGHDSGESRISFISQQIHGQLAHDIWWLVLAVLVISTIETSHFLADPATYSVFNIIFEVVSAYGTVGISVGLPDAAYSFSGGWDTASKLVLCLVMLRGRHRGLPVALDRAVRLPGEQLHRDEEEDHRIRRAMTIRRLSLESNHH